MRYLSLLPFLGLVAIVATTGALFQPGAWYAALVKPAFTPPGWLFGPVWTVIYVLIAISGWMVWRAEGFGLLLSEERSMRAYEHMILQSFLDKYNHNVQLVARKLQIGKSTIYRMLKEVEETT